MSRQRKKTDEQTNSHTNGTTTNGITEESLKDQGNRHFASGNYAKALELFTLGIDTITLMDPPYPPSIDPTHLHLYYSNRSATQSVLRNYQLALEDAESCIRIKPEWAKGYYRKGVALEGLVQFHEALEAYEKGLTMDSEDSTLKKATSDLKTLLSELKSTATKLDQSSGHNPESDRFETMVQWLKDGGARFPRLYLQYYSQDSRGVHCLSDIPSDEIVLYVPHHMIMTSQVAMESPIGKKIVEAQIELRSKHSYLASYLLQEKKKGSESYWAPYINALPQFYDNMPIFFDATLLKELTGSFTLEKIRDRIESLRAEYNNICEHVPEFKQFSHEEFVWARLVVITRIFGLVIRGVKTDGLVAYADMLNHKSGSPADTRWQFDDNLNGFTITSLRSIPRGDQVYDSYGRKCNSRFFVNYGFALENNEEDNEAVMRYQLYPDHPGLAVKARLATRSNLTALKEFQVPSTYRENSDRERKTKDMFGWLRFVNATDTELLSIQHNARGDGIKPEEVEPLTPRLEIEVLKQVQKAARQALAAFETSLEEDNALLKTDALPPFSNLRNCVLQRRGEKQVLRWYDALASESIPLLSMKWLDLRKMAPKYMSSSARDHYVTTVVAVLVKRASGF